MTLSHRLSGLACCTVALMLAACGSPTADASAPAAATPPPIDAASVWNGSTEICRQSATPVDDCLIRTMEASGAAPSAVAAARTLIATGNPGHVSAFRTEGRVGIATVTYPFRANTNEGTLLIPGAGAPIDVDALPDGVEASPQFTAFAATHPEATPFAPATLVRAEPHGDGQRLVYGSPLKTCHACAAVGMVEVAYDFDARGIASAVTAVSVE